MLTSSRSPLRAVSPAARRWWMRGWRSLGVAAFAMTCVLAACNEAVAQDEGTRAGEAAAARRKKAEALADPPEPNKLEAVVTYVERTRLFSRIFNPPRGWFAQVGGLGEGNGFTMGGGYRQPTDLGVFNVRALGSFRESYLGAIEFRRPFLPREAGFVTASVQRRHEAAQRFYGAGPETAFDDQSSFGLSGTLVDVTTGVRVTRWLTVTGGVGFADLDITESSESSSVPDTGHVFAPEEIPGFTVQPDFLTATATMVIDTRDRPNPRRGGLYQGYFRRASDREGGTYSYTTTRLDLQHFVPFWNESRVLAFRLLTEHADGLGQTGQVPFYLMPTLGGARTLRGYDRQRFRDRSLIHFSTEYRYEVNPFLMAALFYDVGQVAPDWSDFRMTDLRDNYGIGFRFGYSNAVALRADFAFGGEDAIQVIIGFSTSF